MAVNASAHFCGQAVFQFPGDGERVEYDGRNYLPLGIFIHVSVSLQFILLEENLIHD